MDKKQILEELQEVKRINEEFLSLRSDEISELIAKENVTAEDVLHKEILIELWDRMQRIIDIIKYIEKTKVQVGRLSLDKEGNILFNGKIIPPTQEFEVCLYDEILKMEIWTRTYVTFSEDGESSQLLCLGRGSKVDGLKARIRI